MRRCIKNPVNSGEPGIINNNFAATINNNGTGIINNYGGSTINNNDGGTINNNNIINNQSLTGPPFAVINGIIKGNPLIQI